MDCHHLFVGPTPPAVDWRGEREARFDVTILPSINRRRHNMPAQAKAFGWDANNGQRHCDFRQMSQLEEVSPEEGCGN